MTQAGGPKRVVVTGASSFVGAHVAAGFSKAAYEVTATITHDERQYDGIRRERLRMVRDGGASLSKLELSDPDTLRELVESTRPDFWIHHAGWAVNYGAADYDLSRGFATNVLGLDHVYEQLHAVGCRGVIVTGSSAEYSDSGHANNERHACEPDTPYGLAKLAETLRARQLARRFGVATRVARVYIPFGPLDAPEKLLSAVERALANGAPIALSPCTQRRDFVHVDDLVGGYLALAQDCLRPEVFDVFNLCSGQAIELREFLLMICSAMGADSKLLQFGAREMRPGEPLSSFGDARKAERLLGWRARDPHEAVRAFLLARKTAADPT